MKREKRKGSGKDRESGKKRKDPGSTVGS